MNIDGKQEREIAVIAENVKFLVEGLKDVKGALASLEDRFATRSELGTLRMRVIELEKQRNWVVGIIVAAVLTAVLTLVFN